MAVALVTGAGIRVGRAVALTLAAEGFDLALHAHASAQPLDEVAAAARALGRHVTTHLADLADPAAADALAQAVLAAHPVLDAVIHNAGLFEQVPFSAVTRAQYRQMQGVNLEAPYFLTQALLPALLRAPQPCVVHITDIAGERPYRGYSHYSVSKAGLIMLTRALAVELGPRVRVNAVSPGTVAFPEHFNAEQRERVLRRVPLEREGTPQDVARAVLFLVRDAPYLTGQVVAVDGGRSCVL